MRKKKLPMISVETMPNGYALRFDGMEKSQGFMYFTPEKLLEGFMLHIGLEMTNQLDTVTMKDFVAAAANWKENRDCVKEIERRGKALTGMKVKLTTMARRLITERTQHLQMIEDVEKLIAKMKDPDKYGGFCSAYEWIERLKGVKDDLEKLLKFRKRPVPLSFDSLGVEECDVGDEEG